ncbi:alpha carbonic anhydrase 4-like [Malania oleifera]|uniref:alpha carbonic anhydrase 4-like n=1 Tax=Malania oleifera TaxID=397392 RepID=UPI0025AE0643|nr:alpha carbonic anhydrase 4-like [Malania oleifera]
MNIHCGALSLLLLLSGPLTICKASTDDSEIDDETPFSYTDGTKYGPKNWGELDPHWRICNHGEMQSPIDLLNRRVQVFPNLGKLKRNYKAAPAILKNRGHDIAVVWKGDAGKININETDYKLIQCHWHSPAEHTINGSRYKMELHLVHESSDGKIAAVGIVYKYGRPDQFLTRMFHHIRSISDVNSVGKEEKNLGIVNPGDIKFGSRKYYRYLGSLTIPPCTEGVVWTISKKVRTVSREQVRLLREAVHDGYEANSRPTQQIGDRRIWLYTPKG